MYLLGYCEIVNGKFLKQVTTKGKLNSRNGWFLWILLRILNSKFSFLFSSMSKWHDPQLIHTRLIFLYCATKRAINFHVFRQQKGIFQKISKSIALLVIKQEIKCTYNIVWTFWWGTIHISNNSILISHYLLFFSTFFKFKMLAWPCQ